MKKTREQKRAEERAIIAQMEEGLKETAPDDFSEQTKEEEPQFSSGQKKRGIFGKPQDPTPEKIHCKRCKTLMENGVCPVCGYKMYVPMDEKKRNAIRLALTAVLIGVFLIFFIATRG